MGRSPCCDKDGVKKGHWTPEEDIILVSYIQEHGPGNWRSVPANTGLKRCSKSCRLRWTNYLRPGIKRGNFTPHEEGIIIHLQALLGKRWAAIASYLPQRTDNDIKNYWNTHLKKKLNHFQQPLTEPHNDNPVPMMAVPPVPKSIDSLSDSLAQVDNIGNLDLDKSLARKSEQACATPTTTATTSYGWSMENISRLLEGWMMRSTPIKMTDESKHQVSNKLEGAKADEINDDDGQMIYDEGFESIMSFENLNATTGSCTSGVYGLDMNIGQIVNLSLTADHSTNWLLDETISASF